MDQLDVIKREVKDFEAYLNELIADMRETKSTHAVNYLKTANPTDKTKFDVSDRLEVFLVEIRNKYQSVIRSAM